MAKSAQKERLAQLAILATELDREKRAEGYWREWGYSLCSNFASANPSRTEEKEVRRQQIINFLEQTVDDDCVLPLARLVCQTTTANQLGMSNDHIYLQSLRALVNRAFSGVPDTQSQAIALVDQPHEGWPKGLDRLSDLLDLHYRP